MIIISNKIKVDLSPHAKKQLVDRYPVFKNYNHEYLITELNQKYNSGVISPHVYRGENRFLLFIYSLGGSFPLVKYRKVKDAYFAVSYHPKWFRSKQISSKTTDVEIIWFYLEIAGVR